MAGAVLLRCIAIRMSCPSPAHETIAASRRRFPVAGGAGVVGASLTVGLVGRYLDWEVLALDNLRRRGSELNLPRLREAGVSFRQAADPGANSVFLSCMRGESAVARERRGLRDIYRHNGERCPARAQ
jgi:hypothetical protein